MSAKQRLSASVDAAVLVAAQAAVADGRAANVSAWVTSDARDLRALVKATGAHVDLIEV